MQVANVHGAKRCSGFALLCTEYKAANYASLQYTESFFFTIF